MTCLTKQRVEGNTYERNSPSAIKGASPSIKVNMLRKAAVIKLFVV